MADAVKSALFVDFDSLFRSLRGARRESAAARLAERSSAWVEAIEAGWLSSSKEDFQRLVLIRRCYADPRLLGSDRGAMIASGFEIVDCPPMEGRQKNSAPIHLVLDAMDALGHPTGYDEFILLSADTDLSPLLLRLRAHNRATAIYASATTPATYRAIADGTIEEAALVTLLTAGDAALAGGKASDSGETQRPAAISTLDRSEVEALARKVHQATSVPLFSPRTYVDLFRALAEEIGEQGYHFQNTAENVTAKLTAAGRNVNRRQVLFVVKGLALKGHVFSTTDTPERLAEVFREQVLYLIENAGIELDEREQGILPAWIIGRAAAPVSAESDAEKPPADDNGAKAPKKRAAKAAAPARDVADTGTAPSKEAAAPKAARPPTREATAAPIDLPPPTPREPAPARAQSPSPASARAAAKPVEEKADAAARTATPPPTATPRPPAPPPPNRSAPAARPAATARPAAPPKAPHAKPAAAARLTGSTPSAEANKEALESSILAAIAQAVDVLVDDEDNPPNQAELQAEPAPPPEETKSEAPPEPEEGEGEGEDEGGGDIGDEIQRIIASYSRARNQGGAT